MGGRRSTPRSGFFNFIYKQHKNTITTPTTTKKKKTHFLKNNNNNNNNNEVHFNLKSSKATRWIKAFQ